MIAYRTIEVDGTEVFFREGGDRTARTLLLLHGFPSSAAQYQSLMEDLDGVADKTTVNPDLWELDQRYLELPGSDQVMLGLLYDYQNNVKLYPHWHEYTPSPGRHDQVGMRTEDQ